MKTILRIYYLSIILICFTIKTYSHNEFTAWRNGTYARVKVPLEAQMSEVIHWNSELALSIPLDIDFTNSAFPATLTGTVALTDFTNAETKWSSATTCFGFTHTSIDAIKIRFTTDESLFYPLFPSSAWEHEVQVV